MVFTFSVVIEGSLNMKLLFFYYGPLTFFDVVEMNLEALSSKSTLISLALFVYLFTLLF